jgi:hypothetical protein
MSSPLVHSDDERVVSRRDVKRRWVHAARALFASKGGD